MFWLGRAILPAAVGGTHTLDALGLSFALAMTATVIYHGGFSETTRAVHRNVRETKVFTSRLERFLRNSEQTGSRAGDRGTGHVLSDYEPIMDCLDSCAHIGLSTLSMCASTATTRQRWSRIRSRAGQGAGIGVFWRKRGLPATWRLEERSDRCLSFFLSTLYPTECSVFD